VHSAGTGWRSVRRRKPLEGKMTKNLLALAAAALLSSGASAAQATITAVDCSVGVNTCSFAHDGNFPAEWQDWTTQTAWWTGMADSVTFTLAGTHLLTGLTVSLDNNDGYLMEASTDGVNWAPLLSVPAAFGSVGYGMDTFSTQVADPQFEASLVFTPQWASQVRISAFEGDGLHSVGELVLASAVPEPGTGALLLAGSLALGSVARRRRA